MRTKELKIGDVKREAVLVAGGQGFKIYHAAGVSGWILALGREMVIIDETEPECQIISNYVNMKYHPVDQQPAIMQTFANLISTTSEQITERR